MSRDRNTFCVHDDNLYVKLKDVMGFWTAAFDALPIVKFDDDTTLYLRVDDAIAWCQKERNDRNCASKTRDHYDLMISVMTRQKQAIADGTATFRDI